jgi:hypothetical protein
VTEKLGRKEVSLPGGASVGKGHLTVGFVLETSSINEDLIEPMLGDALADFAKAALAASGYGKIWCTAAGLDSLINDQKFTSSLWIDPTSFLSYLSALSGGSNYDLLSVSFATEPKQTDFNSVNWEFIRKKLKKSLARKFLLKEHKGYFEESGQSFYIENIHLNGSKALTVEKLESSLEGLRSFSKSSIQAAEFLDFFAPELGRLELLPPFISGHIWAQFLSGCNWELASQILLSNSSANFDWASFSWRAPADNLRSYSAGYSVSWYRNMRRSLNFNPWPWRTDSKNEYFGLYSTALARDQVGRLLAHREPVEQEKVAAFAALNFLIDHDEDNEQDGVMYYTPDSIRYLIDYGLSEQVKEFIISHESLIKDCFVALREFLPDLGDGASLLPEWSGSEGVLAGVPYSWSSNALVDVDGALDIKFKPKLVEAVEQHWPEFISVASQPLPWRFRTIKSLKRLWK